MPQNTQMKRQFTTIDGRTVMSNLPQHWGGNDWKITGVDNPLPVGNYVQTESGVWIPQKGSDDGAADVRLTGSYLEYDIIAPGDEYINIPVGSEFETDIIEVEANEIVLGGRTGSALMGAEFYIAFSYRESVSLTGELVKMFELVGGGERESDHFTQTERTLMAGKGFKIVVKNDKSNRILRLDRLTAKFFNF